jgi:hypothetical protein
VHHLTFAEEVAHHAKSRRQSFPFAFARYNMTQALSNGFSSTIKHHEVKK